MRRLIISLMVVLLLTLATAGTALAGQPEMTPPPPPEGALPHLPNAALCHLKLPIPVFCVFP